MDFKSYLDHPLFEKCVRKYKPGAILFKQGDKAETMFIVVQGSVFLITERGQESQVTHLLRAGQFLGERALVSEKPYERFFTARAADEVVAIELGLTEMAQIQKSAPYITTMLLRRSFEVAAQRLDVTNRLLRALRPTSTDERFIRLLVQLCEATGVSEKEGTRLPRLVSTIRNYLEMDAVEVKSRLTQLERESLLIAKGGEDYIVPSADALLHSLNALPNKKTA